MEKEKEETETGLRVPEALVRHWTLLFRPLEFSEFWDLLLLPCLNGTGVVSKPKRAKVTICNRPPTGRRQWHYWRGRLLNARAFLRPCDPVFVHKLRRSPFPRRNSPSPSLTQILVFLTPLNTTAAPARILFLLRLRGSLQLQLCRLFSSLASTLDQLPGSLRSPRLPGSSGVPGSPDPLRFVSVDRPSLDHRSNGRVASITTPREHQHDLPALFQNDYPQ